MTGSCACSIWTLKAIWRRFDPVRKVLASLSRMRSVENNVEFRNGELCIRYDREHYRIRAWPGPQASVSKDGRRWERCWPEFRFINYPVRRKKVEKKPAAGLQLELGLDLPPVPAAQTKTAAFDQLRQTIPFPMAMALAPFSAHQWNPLVFLHFHRSFLDLLKSSPALAFYLANHRPVSSQIYKESKTLLPRLAGTKQVQLLDYLGLGDTKQMLNIVRKIRPSSVEIDQVEMLLEIRHNPTARNMLSHLESINIGALYLVWSSRRILPHVTPSFLDEVSRDSHNHVFPDIYRRFDHCVTLHREFNPRGAFPRIASLERFNEFYDELSAEQQHRLDEMRRLHPAPAPVKHKTWEPSPFPEPPFPDSEDIVALRSDNDLYEEGRQQHNCVGYYGSTVRVGGNYIYRVLKPERATLRISRHGDTWHVAELKATCNKPAGKDTAEAVANWLSSFQIGATG